MCHSNVDLDMARHRQIFGWQKFPSRRLFTLSEGQTEVKLPDGFGIPLRSDEPLSVTAQVLNHNYHGAADPREAAHHRALRPRSRR